MTLQYAFPQPTSASEATRPDLTPVPLDPLGGCQDIPRDETIPWNLGPGERLDQLENAFDHVRVTITEDYARYYRIPRPSDQEFPIESTAIFTYQVVRRDELGPGFLNIHRFAHEPSSGTSNRNYLVKLGGSVVRDQLYVFYRHAHSANGVIRYGALRLDGDTVLSMTEHDLLGCNPERLQSLEGLVDVFVPWHDLAPGDDVVPGSPLPPPVFQSVEGRFAG